MRTAELARLADVRPSTLRYYERSGLLPPPARDPNGYRRWDDEHLRRVRFLRRGQELGFTLEELAEIDVLSATARGHDGDAGDSGEVHDALARVARGRMADIETRIADLSRMAVAITGLLAVDGFDPDAPCPVVGALARETA